MCGGPNLNWRLLFKVRTGPMGNWGRTYPEHGWILDGFDVALIWPVR